MSADYKPSQYNAETVLKESADQHGKSLRTIDTRSVVGQFYTHFRATYNNDNNITNVTYYRGISAHQTGVYAQPASNLGGKYFEIFSAPDQNKYVVWFNVDSLNTPPVVPNAYDYIEVPVLSSDSSTIVARAIELKTNTSYSNLFTVNRSSTVNYVEILTVGLGETENSTSGDSPILIENINGEQVIVQELTIDYNGVNPIYQGQELIDYTFDVYSGKFVKNPEVTIQNVQIAVELDKNEDSVTVFQTDHDNLNVNANLQVNNTDISSTNLLPTYSPSVVSTLNSTTSLLTAGAIFIGTSEEVKDYASISIFSFSDQASVEDGLIIEWSSNGVDWDDSDTYTTESNVTRFLTFGPEARYFRVRYVNGVVNQSNFRLQVIFHRNYMKPSSHRIKDNISAENDAELTKAVVTAQDPNGLFVNDRASGVDDANSTVIPLTAGATWSGSYVDASAYSTISVLINTDQNSAVDGARIQFSHDGVTIARSIMTTLPASNNGSFFTVPVEAKYYRVVFTNGPVDQTRFIVQSQLTINVTGPATIPVAAKVDDLTSVLVTRSIITGKSTDGNYINQRASGVSSANSTSTPLGAGAVFTGTFEDVLGYANVAVSIYSSHASAVDGLEIQFSSNGIDVDETDNYTISASTGNQFSFGVIARYYRIKYTNGATPQSAFRLSSLYHIAAPKPSSHRIDGTITGQNDAELSKAVLTGKNPDGIFENEGVSGVVSSNTTTTPLGIGGSFQGVYFDTSGFAAVTFACLSSHIGTIVIETSDDGTNIIRTTNANISANTPFFIAQTSVGKYIRIRFNNTSGSVQTSFRLQTMMKTSPISATALTINTPIGSNSIALNSRAVLAGQQENGTFSNVGLSNTASVKVAITDRPSEVRNRTKVEARIFNTSLGAESTVVYAVTAGKILYVESMIVSVLNNTNAIGEWRITDGATDKLGYLLGEKTAGVPATSNTSSPALPEPIPFTTNFGAREISGDIILSIYFIGYEE